MSTPNYFEKLSAGELFGQLEQIQEPDLDRRTRATFRVLTQAAAADDFLVALDFVLERQLLPPELADRLRGASGVPALWTNPIDGSEMIWIAAGRFLVGEQNQPATSNGFYLARRPVTNGQFLRFLNETGYEPSPEHLDPGSFVTNHSPESRADHPVVWVSYVDAAHYCAWAGLQLPTEWLWEKAARGADGRRFPWGDSPPTPKLAHVRATSTCPVGRFARVRSAYGCEEMIGNVSEWCDPLEKVGEFPVAPVDGEFRNLPPLVPVRGSCFLRRQQKGMTSAHRRRLSPHRRNQWVGFRPAFFPPTPPNSN